MIQCDKIYGGNTMADVDYKQPIPAVIERLSKEGVFLNSAFEDKKNTMTIGWGSIGVIWGRPVFIVTVRYSRHTYELINKSGVFTVSIPGKMSLKRSLPSAEANPEGTLISLKNAG